MTSHRLAPALPTFIHPSIPRLLALDLDAQRAASAAVSTLLRPLTAREFHAASQAAFSLVAQLARIQAERRRARRNAGKRAAQWEAMNRAGWGRN